MYVLNVFKIYMSQHSPKITFKTNKLTRELIPEKCFFNALKKIRNTWEL